MTENDPDEYGDVYPLTAIKSEARLFLFHHEGKRSTEDAIELFTETEEMRNESSPIPVFISDNWEAFEEGLLNVYGKFELPQIGRKQLPKLIPFEDLKYIKLRKKKVKRHVVETIQRIIFGDPQEIFKMLGTEADIILILRM